MGSRRLGVARDDHHGALGVVHDRVGDAAEQHRLDASETAPAEDDRRGIVLFGDVGVGPGDRQTRPAALPRAFSVFGSREQLGGRQEHDQPLANAHDLCLHVEGGGHLGEHLLVHRQYVRDLRDR